MVPLSNRTLELVERIYSGELLRAVIQLLENECSDNLPFWEKKSPEGLERFRFAVFKMGNRIFQK